LRVTGKPLNAIPLIGALAILDNLFRVGP
jgi:hypothetical protein